MVQSYVLCAGYSHQFFFTDHTLDLVRAALAEATVFFVNCDFDLWTVLCDPGVSGFVVLHCRLYGDFLTECRRASDDHYSKYNLANRLSRVEQGSIASSVARSTASVSVEKGKGDAKKTTGDAEVHKRGKKGKYSGSKTGCS